jgi:hypothetical protein
MKNKNQSKPPVGVFITPTFFNALIETLDTFIKAEEIIGETDFSKNAVKLKNKIFKYARVYTDKIHKENVAINFCPNESAIMIELILFALTLNRNNTHNYFSELKKVKQNQKKK